MIVGIDPGIKPAIAYMARGTVTVRRIDDVLEDPCDLVVALSSDRIQKVILEQVGPMPGQGLSSSCRFMCAYGIIRGVLAARRIECLLVPPAVWKKQVLPASAFAEKIDKGKRKDEQKEAACQFVRDNYPGVELVKKGCKVADHNLAEAICLAHYGTLS